MSNKNKEIFEWEYLGSCVDSFDMEGSCENTRLPYGDVSAFACGEERAIIILKNEIEEEFSKNMKKSCFVNILNKKDTTMLYDDEHNVYMLYDFEDDVHYFFKREKIINEKILGFKK